MIRWSRRVAAVAVLLLLAGVGGRGAVATESAPPPAPGAIAIDADTSIEWQRDARLVVARGNARAVRGEQRVEAETLTAHYRERPDGSVEVWRLDADGAVRLTAPGESAWAEKATYDLDRDQLVLSGGREVGVATEANRITARERIDYDVGTFTLVARGDAVAIEGERTLSAEMITARLRENPGPEQSRLQRLEATTDVRVVTPDETIRAERGRYDLDSGIATLDGSVKIVRGENELNGCRGEIDLKTGVSKLFACSDQRAGDTRVRGIIIPQALQND